ncbi:MAG: hypothetical protein FJ090_21170 [Deltaproteobacteria bacterium]|nr:hypothetical protein [Deltaproteobacteria bacterium]
MVLASMLAVLGACQPTESDRLDTAAAPQGETGGAPDTDGEEDVTWSNGVAELVQENCVRCHASGRFTTYSPLQTWEQVYGLREKIRAKIQDPPGWGQQMPPFPGGEISGRCEPEFPYTNDLRLTDEEILTVLSWIDAGAPQGSGSVDEPLIAEAPSELDTSTEYPFEEGYVMSIGDDDDDGHRDDWVCVILDPGESDQSRFLSGIQINPDAQQVFRGAVLQLDEHRESLAFVRDGSSRDHGEFWYDCDEGFGFEGRLLGAFLPEAEPFEMPPGSAVEIPGDALVVYKIHYHGHYEHVNPTDTGELPETLEWPDHTSLSLRWEEEAKVERLARLVTFGDYDEETVDGTGNLEPPFLIPEGSTSHVESMVTVVPGEASQVWVVWAVQPEMGEAGRTVGVSVGRATDATTACVGAVPRWSASWQLPLGFDPAAATTVSGGDQLRVDCEYAGQASGDMTLSDESCRAMVGLLPVDVGR